MGDFFKQIASIAVIAALLWFGWQNDWLDAALEAGDSAGERIGERTGQEPNPHVNDEFGDPGDNPDRPYANYNEQALAVLDKNAGDFVEQEGYSRDLFFIYSNSWNKVSREESQNAGWDEFPNEKCNVRNAILIEQGSDVKYSPECKITSGTFEDKYGAYNKESKKVTYLKDSNPKEFDIDHVVALSLGWRSGMYKSDETLRNMFANDRANLVISDKSINRSKGDQSIDEWTPPKKSKNFCDYTDRYAYIKAKYNMIVTEEELTTIKENIASCNA